MLKCGILGVGNIGKYHLKYSFEPLLKENDLLKLEACFDLCEENIMDVDCKRKYTDIDSFFEHEKGKLDFVVICLPTFVHKDISVRALRAGFDVLCEKPMALNAEDGRYMCTVAQETGKTLMIGHVLRFSNDFIYISDCIKNGKLGKVRNVKYTTYGTELPQGHNNWFRNAKLSGGPILDVHIHDTDLILWLFGKPTAVSTIAEREDGNICLDSFSSNLIYDNGMYINIQCDWKNKALRHQSGRSLRINFENGYILKDNNIFLMVDAEGNETNLNEIESVCGNSTSIFRDELKYFVDCLTTSAFPDRCPSAHSVAAVELIEAEIASAHAGGKIISI